MEKLVKKARSEAIQRLLSRINKAVLASITEREPAEKKDKKEHDDGNQPD